MRRKYSETLIHFLSAIAFLLVWFLVFFLVSYFYLKISNSWVALGIFSGNLQNILGFYLAISLILILFSLWFASKFYKEK
ncbi:MAG: hypothetical protein UV58_C0002G0021 [Candidatus Wolfebacteria bacterium GW2011_GWC1_43_10]|uniref:Uncharacterized protein n=2 Tax=Candidatus Wolfeibacteriota TaxID=1752735 RepID=A0A0G1EJ05_9BACT|nr:MAG: hypothetical protein UV58_C0002G0021 [Candidatus Wolfebacteria bacterium GW2011_GWC1_43_10]KKT23068.1 MAG: hypothetical protein UW08_C0001G0031 [Parcubacteria group bacterium GW2011_GWB1_43_8b]OGM89145.1 MAG: hypothetical protein A2108_02205 [Candidatus Wolfebacteria bacterium GWA1_42_9]